MRYRTVDEMREMMSELCDNIQYDRDCMENLRKQIDHLKSEHYKDDALAKMKEEVDAVNERMRIGFPITPRERDAISNWVENHEITTHGRRLRHGVSGGGYSYIFYPTAIGTSGTIKCDICGAEFEFQQI